jgi:hypothetical protein
MFRRLPSFTVDIGKTCRGVEGLEHLIFMAARCAMYRGTPKPDITTRYNQRKYLKGSYVAPPAIKPCALRFLLIL